MTEETEVEGGAALLLAKKIARWIFSRGDRDPEDGGKTQRIQFMGGTWPLHEVRMGGFDEVALTGVIRQALEANVDLGIVDKSSMAIGTCGNFCEACARRDDEIRRLRELTKSAGWLCPKCGRGNAPTCMTCLCVPVEYKVT